MSEAAREAAPTTALGRLLNLVERAGNRLPDPAMLFVIALTLTWVLSAALASASFVEIFVPMLMQVNLAPELTQAAYRIGDSTTNIITPLMPYFPLVVVFCQRYVRKAGIGTLVSMMLPYSLSFLVIWTAFLLVFWALGIPLGLQSAYVYP